MLKAPKAIYKAQQAKKQMQKIQAAGVADGISVLMNGLNDTEAVEIDDNYFIEILKECFDETGINEVSAKKAKQKLADAFKKAAVDAKKQLEKELMNSTSLDDLKSLLG